MPFFYSHLRGPDHVERDTIGAEHDSVEAAYLDVCDGIPDIAGDLMREGRNPLGYVYDITDATGTLLVEVPFSDLLRRTGEVRRPPLGNQGATSCVERTHDLVVEAQEQVDALRKGIRASREWLEQLRREREE